MPETTLETSCGGPNNTSSHARVSGGAARTNSSMPIRGMIWLLMKK